MRERENETDGGFFNENRHSARDYLIRHSKLSADGAAVTRDEPTGQPRRSAESCGRGDSDTE
jgi:hypothetical protein